MRALLSALAALSMIAVAAPAAADPVRLTPATYSADFQEELEDKYGLREGVYLQERLTNRLTRALTNAGAEISDAAPVTIETIIIDAAPNRPTYKQLGDEVSLSYAGSFSIGGAELNAVLRGADGQALREVSHRFYSASLQDVSPASDSWHDARRAIDRFARKVADAYQQQSRQAAR